MFLIGRLLLMAWIYTRQQLERHFASDAITLLQFCCISHGKRLADSMKGQ